MKNLKNDIRLESDPLFEPIHRSANTRREAIKKTKARKSHCYKLAYTRKQVLTARSVVMRDRKLSALYVYKCTKCHYWHLTHHRPKAPPQST
jgi:hypothetical protein